MKQNWQCQERFEGQISSYQYRTQSILNRQNRHVDRSFPINNVIQKINFHLLGKPDLWVDFFHVAKFFIRSNLCCYRDIFYMSVFIVSGINQIWKRRSFRSSSWKPDNDFPLVPGTNNSGFYLQGLDQPQTQQFYLELRRLHWHRRQSGPNQDC